MLTLTAALAGCQAEVDHRQAAPEPATAAINAVDRALVADGGTLTWGINEFPTQWNPHHQAGNLAAVHTVLEALLPIRSGSMNGRSPPQPRL